MQCSGHSHSITERVRAGAQGRDLETQSPEEQACKCAQPAFLHAHRGLAWPSPHQSLNQENAPQACLWASLIDVIFSSGSLFSETSNLGQVGKGVGEIVKVFHESGVLDLCHTYNLQVFPPFLWVIIFLMVFFDEQLLILVKSNLCIVCASTFYKLWIYVNLIKN